MGVSRIRTYLSAAVLAALAPTLAHADLAACAGIASDSARLACYDALARTARAPADAEAVPAPTAKREVPSQAAPAIARAGSMDEHWELRPEFKRGIFGLTPHRPLYGLIHWTDSRTIGFLTVVRNREVSNIGSFQTTSLPN